MIAPTERLRVDYERFDAAQLPSAQLSVVIRRNDASGSVDAAHERRHHQRHGGDRGAEGSVEGDRTGRDFRRGRARARRRPPAGALCRRTMPRSPTPTSSRCRAATPRSAATCTTASRPIASSSSSPISTTPPSMQLTRHKIPAILARHFGAMPAVSADISGVTVLWANMDNAISRGQIASTAAMSLTCFITFFLSLRSWRLAFAAMFVNVLPVAVIGAALGATGSSDRHGDGVHHGHFARHRRRRHELLRPQLSRAGRRRGECTWP